MLNAIIIFIAFIIYSIKCGESKEIKHKEDDMNAYFSYFKREEIQPSYLIYEDSKNGNIIRKELKRNGSFESLLDKHNKEFKISETKLYSDKNIQEFVDIEL